MPPLTSTVCQLTAKGSFFSSSFYTSVSGEGEDTFSRKKREMVRVSKNYEDDYDGNFDDDFLKQHLGLKRVVYRYCYALGR